VAWAPQLAVGRALLEKRAVLLVANEPHLAAKESQLAAGKALLEERVVLSAAKDPHLQGNVALEAVSSKYESRSPNWPTKFPDSYLCPIHPGVGNTHKRLPECSTHFRCGPSSIQPGRLVPSLALDSSPKP